MMDLKDELQGKLALLTWITSGSGDVGPVPGDPQFPLGGIHANVVNTILTGDFLRRLTPTTTFIVVTLPLLLVLYAASLRLRTLPFLASAIGIVLLHAAGATAAFLWAGLIVDIPGPILVLAGGTIVVAAYHYHLESEAKAVLRSTFDAYFPPRVVDRILSASDDLARGARKREITILFSDIKGFTNLTASMDAGHVRALLNEYFGRMIEIVFRHEGTLDKFLGDGLMVFFGDPEAQPDHAARCVAAAMEMQQAVRQLDREWRARGDMPLAIRVGINTGEAIVGNMGSARRLSYTALGRAVNLAQRLEANAPVGGILISERTNALLAGAPKTVRREPIQVKGIDEDLVVYEVVQDGVGEES
jgi:adenylate cyclase